MNCANHPETAAAAFCRECGKPLCPECIRRARGSVFCAEHVPSEDAAAPPFGTDAGAPAPPFGTAAGFAPSSAGSSYFATASAFESGAAASSFDAAPGRGAQSPLPPSPYTVAPLAAPVAPAQYSPGVPPAIALILGFIPGVGAICNGQYAKGLIHAVIFGLLVSAAATTHLMPVDIICGIMIAAWVFYMAFESFHTALRRRRGLPVEEFSSIFEIRSSHNRMPLGAILLVVIGFILLLQTTDIISMEVFARYWPVGLIALGIYLLYMRVHPAEHANGSEHDVELHR
jgi:Domain of unknown function (DUF5668)/B-box zinc finger